MTISSSIPFVHVTVEQEADSTRRLQVLTCSAQGCDCTKTFPVKSKALPQEALYGIARKAGWSLSKKAALCPQHSGKRKKPQKETPVDYTPGPRQAHATPAPELTPELRRSIFRAIDQHYDEAARCYRGVVSDRHIAAATGASEADVSAVREENFGPAINAQLAEIMDRLKKAEERRDQASAMLSDAKGLLNEVNAEIEALTDLLTKG